MALPSPALTWTSLTSTVNQVKRPGRFLNQLIKPREETLPTETVEIGVLTGQRDMAPFVRKGSEALMVGGLGESMYVVQAPNIRIKRPFNANELFSNQRHVGTAVFPTEGEVISSIEQKIARDMQYMIDMVENAEEWMLSQALRGAISYSNLDEEVFTMTFARSAGNTITPSTFWDAGGTPEADVRAIMRLISEVPGGGITDAILGTEAATTFMAHAAVKATINTQANLNAGSLDLSQRYREDGALFLGRWMSINWWEYPRVVYIKGVSTPLIRAKYAEFVSATPSADWVRYYGAIPDISALQGGTLQAKRFAKSWVNEDPSALMALLHSRPMPVPRIPDTTVSFKMVSG